MIYDSLTHSPFLNFVQKLNLRRKKTFRKPVLFPSLGKQAPNLADPIDRDILSTKETLNLLRYGLYLFLGTHLKKFSVYTVLNDWEYLDLRVSPR
jgi:hypothetical protein